MSMVLPCRDCDDAPAATCRRCQTKVCERHRPASGRRCRRCEHDYADSAPIRNRLKALLAGPAAIVAAALGLGLLLPITGPGLLGSIVVSAGAALAASAIGGAIIVGVERTARAQFLREHGRELPEARVVRHLLPHRAPTSPGAGAEPGSTGLRGPRGR